MTEKKRPPRYSDIIELSHKPPVKKPAVSPFTLAYDAEEKRLKEVASPDPSEPVFDAKSTLDAKGQFDAKNTPFDAKFDAKPDFLDAKAPNYNLTPNPLLTPNSDLAPKSHLTPRKERFPSWDVPRLYVRIPSDLQDRMRFLGMSRGLSLQDTVLLAIQSLLASEGLASNLNLASNGVWRLTDQMIDDAEGVSTSSIQERPEDLIAYYAKWTNNPIRQIDWQALKSALSYSPLAVKAGILMSILRTKTRVNSFKYCLGAIDEVAKAGVVNSAEYVRYLELKVEKSRAETQPDNPT